MNRFFEPKSVGSCSSKYRLKVFFPLKYSKKVIFWYIFGVVLVFFHWKVKQHWVYSRSHHNLFILSQVFYAGFFLLDLTNWFLKFPKHKSIQQENNWKSCSFPHWKLLGTNTIANDHWFPCFDSRTKNGIVCEFKFHKVPCTEFFKIFSKLLKLIYTSVEIHEKNIT